MSYSPNIQQPYSLQPMSMPTTTNNYNRTYLVDKPAIRPELSKNTLVNQEVIPKNKPSSQPKLPIPKADSLAFSPVGVGVGAILGGLVGGFGVKLSKWGTIIEETKTEKKPTQSTSSSTTKQSAGKSSAPPPVPMPTLPVIGNLTATNKADFTLHEGYQWQDPSNYLAITHKHSGFTYKLNEEGDSVLTIAGELAGGSFNWKLGDKDIKQLTVAIDKDHSLSKILQKNLSGKVIKDGSNQLFEPSPEGWFIQYEREIVQKTHSRDSTTTIGKHTIVHRKGDLFFKKDGKGLLTLPEMLTKERAFLCNEGGKGAKILEFELANGGNLQFDRTKMLDALDFNLLGRLTLKELEAIQINLNGMKLDNTPVHATRYKALDATVIPTVNELIVTVAKTVQVKPVLSEGDAIAANAGVVINTAVQKTTTALTQVTEKTATKTKLNSAYIIGGAIGLGLFGGLVGYFLTKEIKDETPAT